MLGVKGDLECCEPVSGIITRCPLELKMNRQPWNQAWETISYQEKRVTVKKEIWKSEDNPTPAALGPSSGARWSAISQTRHSLPPGISKEGGSGPGTFQEKGRGAWGGFPKPQQCSGAPGGESRSCTPSLTGHSSSSDAGRSSRSYPDIIRVTGFQETSASGGRGWSGAARGRGRGGSSWKRNFP